jgi:hypothetical protein
VFILFSLIVIFFPVSQTLPLEKSCFLICFVSTNGTLGTAARSGNSGTSFRASRDRFDSLLAVPLALLKSSIFSAILGPPPNSARPGGLDRAADFL